MIRENIQQLLVRDLQRLQQEIDAYEEEWMIWETAKGINNSAGNLCLHLAGNLNTYIGNILGNTGYVRDRDAEFSLKNIPKSSLLEEINKVKLVVEQTIPLLSDEQLAGKYPSDVLGYPMSTQHFLLHLISHFNYHLGQVNYHRRILRTLKTPG